MILQVSFFWNPKRAVIKTPMWLGYIGDYIVPNIGIMTSHCKDPYQPISIMECHWWIFFERCSSEHLGNPSTNFEQWIEEAPVLVGWFIILDSASHVLLGIIINVFFAIFVNYCKGTKVFSKHWSRKTRGNMVRLKMYYLLKAAWSWANFGPPSPTKISSWAQKLGLHLALFQVIIQL